MGREAIPFDWETFSTRGRKNSREYETGQGRIQDRGTVASTKLE